jgi:hypothetical protein
MVHRSGTNPFNPLILGAAAIIIALVAFLIFREGPESTQQAGIQSQPPATTNPAPTNPAPAPQQRSGSPATGTR